VCSLLSIFETYKSINYIQLCTAICNGDDNERESIIHCSSFIAEREFAPDIASANVMNSFEGNSLPSCDSKEKKFRRLSYFQGIHNHLGSKAMVLR